jgi:hypothetical protein
MANTTGEWPKSNYRVDESTLRQAAFVKARFKVPESPEFSESLWVRVSEVQPARRKVIGRIYKGGGITDYKMGDKVVIDYADIEDMRERTSIGIAEMLASLK